MLRVVLDTNVLVSALFWEGNERKALRRCKTGEFRLITSPGILEELERVLMRKFDVPEEKARGYLRELIVISEIVFPMGEIHVIDQDPADDIVLETAVLGRADMIITGDEHLIKFKKFKSVDIKNARDLILR